ncbi:MAG TPA: UDP-N-acetylmuramoyl-tripeptide--D-alanyl-D-alanine ligase [Candidatus Aminicenantes bacterium]|nr:UDP-N-acetylmuramoyl-tripeptide--D-alanyl-D-alanine ligase [Candidatus Aminicenantes bacterium]HRY65078.1 UDP-N-acetylmuramoyl-tripeptide--D-alanyl-D-alanine ligase [Candidatus Aminicenantes bacterium]HRZ71991.1 UDP-N-acetylmuramoyl-tripeptide--D-alanyl-D-alanine ligase [Candidatus Aminicenantes bacterium]
MAALKLDAVARIAGGTILRGAADLVFTSYAIDSRLCGPGSLFFAVPGRRDGHDFVAAAAAAGAAGAVVTRPVPDLPPGFALVSVPDTVAALQALARGVLARRPVKVVGVTGSVGKTTAKEFAAALLARRFRVLRSEGNFNNHLGLALSLLRLEPAHEVAVLEMGMSAPGEILALTRIAPPDVAVITNVSPVHLEFFGGLGEIARAKKEILDGAKPGATAVLNGDDPLVLEAAAGFAGPKVLFGLEPGCQVRAEDVVSRGYDGFDLLLRYGKESGRVLLPCVNRSSVSNLLAAAAVGLVFGLGLDEILPAVRNFRPAAMRGAIVEAGRGLRLYDDSYNSNPRALEAALASLAVLPAARRVAVLADMLELGPDGPEFHRQAGRTVARTGWDVLIAVGPLAASIADGAAAAGMPAAAIHRFADAAAAAAALPDLVRDGDLVLVKGSRGMRTETVVQALRARGKE